jgi:hypothetical protein
VIGGNAGRGSVALVVPAPAVGAVVSLTTDNPTYIHVPATVAIAGGNSTVSFDIPTSPVATLPTGGFVNATAGGVTKSIFVNVAPDPNAPPILKSVALSPTSVVGGNNVTGTVFLNSPAPAGGLTATLSSSNLTGRAPGVVSIPAGATSVNFTVTTSPVTTTTVVSIQAIVGAESQSATLTITKAGTTTPPPTPAPPTGALAAPSLVSPAADARVAPGQNILFDWSDVAGAASYTIQISDQSSFPAPLIVDQVVATSQANSSTLPTKTMWFRARANDSSGSPGAWSSARRFEVKN